MGLDKDINGSSYKELRRTSRHSQRERWDAEKRALAKLTKSKIEQALKVTRPDLKAPSFEDLLTHTVSQLRHKLDAAVVVLDQHAEAEARAMSHRQLANEVARLRKRKERADRFASSRDEALRANLRTYGGKVGPRSSKTRIERGQTFSRGEGLPDYSHLIEPAPCL